MTLLIQELPPRSVDAIAVGNVDLFVTVGTDHHPFDRLISWVDKWLENRGVETRPKCLVQSGTSVQPRKTPHRRYLDFGEVEALFAQAAVVVSHGGPGTIMLCRYYGLTPIVVPRRREYDEHVDNHQVEFCTKLGSSGLIKLVGSEQELHAALDACNFESRELRRRAIPTHVQSAVTKFALLVDPMMVKR